MFNCNATGFPLPTFVWKKNNATVGNSADISYSGDSKVLTISSVKQSDAGNYSCGVSQPYKTEESSIAVLTVYCMYIHVLFSVSLYKQS